MKKKLINSLYIIFIVISVILIYNLYDLLMTIEKRELDVNLMVGSKYGIDLNGTALTFGMITPGGSTNTRQINLTNNYGRDVKIVVYSKGDVSDFIIVSENNFFLKPNETKTLAFVARAPVGAKFGNYSGKAIIKIQKNLF